jgi:hypothetical protein
VAREVVVERDRDREALPTPAAADGVEQFACGNDAVMPPEVAHLPSEQAGRDGREDLDARITGRLAADTVVHEGGTGPGRRQPRQPAGEEREHRPQDAQATASARNGLT